MNSAPTLQSLTIDTAALTPAQPAEPPTPATPPARATSASFVRLLVWSLLPMALWYTAANSLAHYFSLNNEWVNLRHEAVALYAMATLYAVPWMLTIITGFMTWGYALRMYGAGQGTLRAFGIFAVQWLAVWAMTYASVHWHYVYFYTEQVYS